jgi:hypothetical protein
MAYVPSWYSTGTVQVSGEATSTKHQLLATALRFALSLRSGGLSSWGERLVGLHLTTQQLLISTMAALLHHVLESDRIDS